MTGARPKRLRCPFWHAAGPVRRGCRLILRHDDDWPWAEALATASRRLQGLPPRA